MERIALPATLPAKGSQFATEILRRIRAVLIPSSGGQWFTTEGVEGLCFIWNYVSHGGSAGNSPCPGFTWAKDGKPQPGLYLCCSKHQSLVTIPLELPSDPCKGELMSKPQLIITFLNRDNWNQYSECGNTLRTFLELFVGFRMFQFNCTTQSFSGWDCTALKAWFPQGKISYVIFNIWNKMLRRHVS